MVVLERVRLSRSGIVMMQSQAVACHRLYAATARWIRGKFVIQLKRGKALVMVRRQVLPWRVRDLIADLLIRQYAATAWSSFKRVATARRAPLRAVRTAKLRMATCVRHQTTAF